MTKPTLYIIFAAVIFGLIPLVPKMICVRTKVLYALHLRGFAAWHERNSEVLTVVVRITFAAIGICLLVLGFSGY